MPTISKYIKSQLIKNQLKNKLSSPDGVATSTVTGQIGRAYAAEVLSVLNYGFNVANRSELREESNNEISWGESGIDFDLANSGRYVRSETGHPSREVYDLILKLYDCIPTVKMNVVLSGYDFNNKKQRNEAYGKLQDKLFEKNKQISETRKDFVKRFHIGLLNINLEDYGFPSDNDLNSLLENAQNYKKIGGLNDNVKIIKGDIENLMNPQLKENRLLCIDKINELVETLQTLELLIPTDQYQSLKINLELNRKLLELNVVHLFNNKSDGEKAYWLGQWRTPEDIIETLYSLLTYDEVNCLSKHLLNQARDKLKDYKGVEAPVVIDLSNYKFHQSGTFNNVMDKRVSITKALGSELSKVDSKLIKVEAPKTDYPCVIFDLRNLITHLKKEQEKNQNIQESKILLEALEVNESKVSSSTIVVLNNMLLSYLAGKINKHSQIAYGEKYIEIQPQGSFGSIRPSITDTGYSFRLSPGLVPDSFKTVLDGAYKEFLDDLSEEKTQEALLKLLNQEAIRDKIKEPQKDIKKTESELNELKNTSDKNVINAKENELKGLRLKEEELIQNAKKIGIVNTDKKVQKITTIEQIITNNAARIKISDLAKNDRGLQDLCNVLIDNLKMKLDDFCKIQEQKIENSQKYNQKKSPDAPYELLGMYHNLIVTYHKHQSKFKADKEEIKDLDKIINYVISEKNKARDYSNSTQARALSQIEENEAPDYSTIATKVESLCRLLQIRYEMEIEVKRKNTLKINKENGVLENDLLALNRQTSIDSTLTKEEDNITTPSRSGMAGFTRGIHIINKAYKELQEKDFTGHMGEIYFEIDKDTPKEMYQYHFKQEENEMIVKDWVLNEDEQGEANVKFIDIAPFPRHKSGSSKPSVWKGDWSSIHENDRPEILMIDMTSSTQKDMDHLYKQFNQSEEAKPYAIMLFASDNKYGQGGIDLTCMGELRLVTKSNSQLGQNQKADDLNQKLKDEFKKVFEEQQENNTSAKAYRKVLRDAGLRRTSEGLKETSSPQPLFSEQQSVQHYDSLKMDEINVDAMMSLKQQSQTDFDRKYGLMIFQQKQPKNQGEIKVNKDF